MKKVYILCAFALFMLCACSVEDDASPAQTSEENEVTVTSEFIVETSVFSTTSTTSETQDETTVTSEEMVTIPPVEEDTKPPSPTPVPTATPTVQPTQLPSPTPAPTPSPTPTPTPQPSQKPTYSEDDYNAIVDTIRAYGEGKGFIWDETLSFENSSFYGAPTLANQSISSVIEGLKYHCDLIEQSVGKSYFKVAYQIYPGNEYKNAVEFAVLYA